MLMDKLAELATAGNAANRQVQSCCWVLLVLVSLSFLQHLSITALHHHITIETLQLDGCRGSNRRVAEFDCASHHH